MKTTHIGNILSLLAAVLLLPQPGLAAPALQLQLPSLALETAQRVQELASSQLVIGPFKNGDMATQVVEGAIEQTAWKIPSANLSTLQVMQDLRQQITADGFELIYECETEACGGFDFRYGIEIIPEPDMHVDLGDFRYLVAKRSQGPEYLTLMISRSSQSSFVQVTRIGGQPTALTVSTKTPTAPVKQEVAASLPPVASVTDLGKLMDAGLPQVLEDLVFASGSATLAAGDYASLHDLAIWLKANPDKAVTLVGHTDASGGLAGNTALSKKRAESVRQALLNQFDIPAAQVASNGVGPLAPRASNLTSEGQQKNRRVEVLLTSTP